MVCSTCCATRNPSTLSEYRRVVEAHLHGLPGVVTELRVPVDTRPPRRRGERIPTHVAERLPEPLFRLPGRPTPVTLTALRQLADQLGGSLVLVYGKGL